MKKMPVFTPAAYAATPYATYAACWLDTKLMPMSHVRPPASAPPPPAPYAEPYAAAMIRRRRH